MEMEKKDKNDEAVHICGETGGRCIIDFTFCKMAVNIDDSNMIGNTSVCIPCYEKCEEKGLID